MGTTTAAPARDAVPVPEGESRRALASFGYRPGLDGLRALALLAVLAFHHGWPGARGGYLGVSSFFTLSGFLITTLALGEWERTGRLSWRRFWERRVRRLLPAAVVTLVAVLGIYAWLDTGWGPGVRGDVLAALGYGANWHSALEGGGYAQLFAAPSPVVHFWSLAIEEQFYVLFPLAFTGAMVLAGRGRRLGTASVVFTLAAVVSFAAAWVSASRYGNDGIAYYGTHTRAGELLVGVALAVVLARVAPRRSRALQLAGLAAVVGLALLWHSVPIGDPRLFHGATALNALLTAVLVAAVAGAGWLDRALGVAPLRGLGKVSYGAYLFHWPIFLVLAPPRFELASGWLFALRLGVTVVAAVVSYVAIEAPFRFRLPMPRPRLVGMVAAGALVVVALAYGLPQRPPAFEDLAAAGAGVGASTSAAVGEGEGGGAAPGPGRGLPPATDVRMTAAVAPPDGSAATDEVFLAGDSVAYSIRTAFHFWNTRAPERTFQVDTHISFGCPVGGPGVVRGVDEHDTPRDCGTWRTDLPGALVEADPDVVVMVMGLLDLNGREVDGRWRELGDPEHDDWLRGEMDEVADLLESGGVPVVWLNFPHVRARDVEDPTRPWDTLAINEPWKVDRFNELLAEVVADHEGIELVDFASWLDTWPNESFDPDMRDGVHFSYAGSDKVGDWLIPRVFAAIDG